MRFFRSLFFFESENQKKRLTRAVSKIEAFLWLVRHSLGKDAQNWSVSMDSI
jgi:hypothetical protein